MVDIVTMINPSKEKSCNVCRIFASIKTPSLEKAAVASQAIVFQMPLFPHARAALFVGHAFPDERDGQPTFKFDMKKSVLLVYWMMHMLDILGRILTLGVFPTGDGFVERLGGWIQH
jgi:hypothetical protein